MPGDIRQTGFVIGYVSKDKHRTWGRHRASRLRLDRYPQGIPTHVTISTLRKRRLFEERHLADTVFGLLRDHPETIAAVLMPDHVHWLLPSASTLVETVAKFKSLSTRRAWQLGYRGRLWQRSYFDTLVRGRENLRRTIEYIQDNPTRAGVVENAAQYPWSVVFPNRIPR